MRIRADTLRVSAGVQYFFNTMPEPFATYQKKLVAGIEPTRAFAESFPGLAPDELDKELRRFSKVGKFREFERPVDEIKVATAPAKITAGDVLAIRGQFAFISTRVGGSEMNAEAHRDIEEALRLETGNVLALRVLRAVDGNWPKDAAARLRKQTEQRPDDAEAWLLLSDLLPPGTPEREAAMRKATALEPRNADAVNALAWELVQTGRNEAALPLATKAALLAPWSPEVLDTYSVALFGVARCPDALAVEKRALDGLSEQASPVVAATLTKRIAEYEKACGTKSAP